MRIFIDVDDTLVLWDKEDEGEWYPNFKVIGYALWVYNTYADDIIVWSGGGKDYANRWCTRLGIAFATPMAKDIRLPMRTDIIIDDQSIKVAGLLVHPDDIGNKIIK